MADFVSTRGGFVGIAVIVRTMGRLGDMPGGGRLDECLEEGRATLADLIQSLSSKYGKFIEELLLDPGTGDLSGSMVVIVDGKAVGRKDPRGVQLKDGSTVFLMAALDGG